MIAIQSGNDKVVELLCNCSRVKIMNMKNGGGRDALDIAAQCGEISIFQRILLTLIDRFNVTSMNKLIELKILTKKRFDEWVELAQLNKHKAFLTFLSKIFNNAFKLKQFEMLQTMLDNSETNEQFDESYQKYKKDFATAKYLFDNCDKSTLNTLNGVINDGIKKQECGFNDSLLFLAQMTDKDKLTSSLQECTKVTHMQCLFVSVMIYLIVYDNNIFFFCFSLGVLEQRIKE